MPKIHLFLLISLALLGCNTVAAQNTGVNKQDSLSLVDLYRQTGGEQWTNNFNWLNGPVHTWFGISVVENRVTEIDLHSNALKDTLPESFQKLTALKTLILYSNNLSGNIPVWLDKLTKLEYIHLAGNSFTGNIPPELGNLSNLKYLYLYSNQLEGNIPPELGQLNNLINIYLQANKLTGSIPASLGNLQNLSRLYLYSNQLEGNIPPELGNLQNLYVLYLHNNNISGNIPAGFGQLTNLRYLYLNNNKMSGALPPEMAGMSNLFYLQLNNNNFDSSIPPEWGQLTGLRTLHLHMNQLKGSIPAELGQLPHLVNLNLSLNQLTGSIPPELGDLGRLQLLDLSINQLTGTMPEELGQLTSLVTLNLNLNSLSGDIPASLNRLTGLETLNLSSNNFTGFLPDSLFILPGNSNISVYYNNLTFEDLEDKSALFDRYFYYSPQYKIGQGMVISADTGANYTLNVKCGGSQNQYQWFFEGEALHEPSGSPEYQLTNIGEDNIGSYTCTVTSPLVPGLTLTSHPINIQFKPVGDQPPTDILLSITQIEEESPIGTEIGEFLAIDSDFDDLHFFTLTEGEGDNDNNRFFIAGNKLYNAEVFDYEKKTTYHIRVRTTDRAGNTFEKTFAIEITDIVELPPSDILLSNTYIHENLPVGQLIGTFSTRSNGDTLTTQANYTFNTEAGATCNDNFFIAANQLHSNVVFDYETTDSCTISVTATDEQGQSISKTFTIDILDDESDNEGGNTPKALRIPGAFSPNSDGYNDSFIIEGLENDVPAGITIFSRSGMLVYQHEFTATNQSRSFPWWDGTMNNDGKTPLPEGYYFVILTTGEHEQHKETIYLKR